MKKNAITIIKCKNWNALWLLFSLFAASLSAQTAYKLTGRDVEVDQNGLLWQCTYNFSNKNIIIPSTSDGYTVTKMSNGVFRSKGITSVTLPNTLTRIGNSAFGGNSLTGVTIPNSVIYIGPRAFSNSGLTSITLPSPNKSVGWVDGKGNDHKNGATVSDFSTSYRAKILPYTLKDDDAQVDRKGLLWKCTYNFSNKNIIIPSTLDGHTITTIGNSKFYGKGITSITLPNTITRIETSAFGGNNLIDLTIPNSVTYIGEYAFYNSLLGSITLPSPAGSLGWKDGNGNDHKNGATVSDLKTWYKAKMP